jgi:cytochrome P450 family 142 subfamily A polypeptide 1
MDFNVLDPGFYAEDPYPAYAWLRDNDPVAWDDINKTWLISRYEDVAFVSKNPKLFCSGQGVMVDADIPISIVTMDDPEHTLMRGLVSRGFTPRMIAPLEDKIRDLARSSVDAIAGVGECDFVAHVAVPIPLMVIAEMIGIRREDRDAFWHWSDTMIAAAGQYDKPDVVERATQAYIEYAAYLNAIFDDRRRNPREDIVSRLVAAEGDGRLSRDKETLEADELLQFMTLLLVAGNETTRNAISGGLLALIQHPAQLAKLLDRPELLTLAVNEIVRWVSPIIGFRRTAVADTVLRDRTIRAGDKVLMLYQSANRDPEAWDDPDTFRIDRESNDHLAFGIGTHFCLGANLARQEIRIVLEEMLWRLRDLRLKPGGRLQRVSSPLVYGLESMDIAFSPEPTRVRASASA